MDRSAQELSDPVVSARDVTYRRGSYRSFEHVSFEARAGALTALVASAHAPVRDLLLAVAGIVAPTAGSLAVGGVELVRRAGSHAPGRTRRRALARGTTGVGVCAGVSDAAPGLTVEEAVSRELALRGHGEVDALAYLAAFRLATVAGQRAACLGGMDAARFSAALACAGEPVVAVVDLADPSMGDLSAREARDVIGELAALARARRVALVVGLTEPAAAQAADQAYGIDLDAAERLAALAGAGHPAPGRAQAPASAQEEVDAR